LVPNKTKTIAGYQCKLAQVKINDTEGGFENDTLDIWYTEELPRVYWEGFDELRQIPGATLQITTPTGIEMVAQSVVKSELNDNDFIIPKQYKQIDKADSPLEKK